MAAMIDKYVSSNDSHALATFFDHEVFRKSYHEIRRTLIDTNEKKGAAAITDEFEHQLRDKVRNFLAYQFGAAPEDEDLDDANNNAMNNNMAQLNSIEQATATYSSMKRMKYSTDTTKQSKTEESVYTKQLGPGTQIRQMMQAMNDKNAAELKTNQTEFDQILRGQPAKEKTVNDLNGEVSGTNINMEY